MKNSKAKGYLFGAVAAASYGLNPLFTLPLYRAGLSADSVLFYRYLFAVVILGAVMFVRRRSFALKSRHLLPLGVMGLLFSFSSLTLFESYNRMDAGVASTILFLYPVFVAVIMALFFREKLSIVTMFSITLAFAGILMLYKGEGGQTLDTVGVGLVFISSLCYAIYIVGVNRSSLRELSSETLTFYALLAGLSVYVVRLGVSGGWQAVPSAAGWVDVISLAIFPTVVSLLTMALAIRRIGSTPTAILGALEPVTALFFGVLVFGEALTMRIIAGVLLILTAVTLIIAGKPLLTRMSHISCLHRLRIPFWWRR